MSLFRRHRSTSRGDAATGVPSPAGVAEFVATHGWQPAAARPFDGHLEDAVHEITRVMYGAPRGYATDTRVRVGQTIFKDAFSTSVNGRTVKVSNAWTNIQSEVQHAPDHWRGVAVCAAELPSLLPLSGVYPRAFAAAARVRPTPTGNPAFDERFVVAAAPNEIGAMLTPEVQARMMARDDWCFYAERYLFGCMNRGPFASVEEMNQRIDEVLGIIEAIPSSVLPDRVDHSADDLIARVNQLTSLEDAMAMLMQLTPADRERLAQSDTPLAALADVKTPQEAMDRFKEVDPASKNQLIAMFMRVKDTRGST